MSSSKPNDYAEPTDPNRATIESSSVSNLCETVTPGAPAPLGLGDKPLPARPSKLTSIATWLTIIALGVAFGLCVGIAYGVSNHFQYLVHGLHALDPSFLANDWFTCQTRAHHITFTPLIVGMTVISRSKRTIPVN